MAAPDCRKPLGGEPLKYISVQSPHWLRNDGIVERRSSDGRTLLQHRHVPRESPWVALSAGAVGGAHLALVCEMAWLRADGAVDLTVTACYFNYNGGARNCEAALIHDFNGNGFPVIIGNGFPVDFNGNGFPVHGFHD